MPGGGILGSVTASTDRLIELRSDNAAGVAPYILDAIAAANAGSALAYGGDAWTARLHERVSEVFEHEAAVFPVVSGTAANAIALSALCPPWGAMVCHTSAHINVNEAAAASMFSGGGALMAVDGADAKLTPDAVRHRLRLVGWGDPHHSQPSVLSLTQPTDLGSVYRVDEVAALAELARGNGMRVHLDGARIANAIVSLGVTPAELTWRAGVEILTLGATKNGALSTDAIVCFDAALATELGYRLKRAGHVASKLRFQSAQLDAYLTEERWLTTAAVANTTMRQLVAGLAELGIAPVASPDANMVFVVLPDAVTDAWERSGVAFYRLEDHQVRLVTSFATTADDVDEALTRLRVALAAD